MIERLIPFCDAMTTKPFQMTGGPRIDERAMAFATVAADTRILTPADLRAMMVPKEASARLDELAGGLEYLSRLAR